MAKFKFIFLVICAFFYPNHLYSTGYIGEINGVFYNQLNARELEITYDHSIIIGQKNVETYKGDFVIPSHVTYKGRELTVTSIGEYAFYNCSYMTSIMIPNSIEEIKDYAFLGCPVLNYHLPNSIKKIGNQVFRWSGIQIHVSSIEQWLNMEFGHWSHLSYDLSLYVNGELAKDLVIPEGITKIPDYAFYFVSSIKTLTLPRSLDIIGINAFGYCRNLETINFSENLTHIGKDAFQYCVKLNLSSLPNSISYIGSGAFADCYNIESIVLPQYIKDIESFTFFRCKSLKKIVLPTTLISIGQSALDSCSFESILIPKNIKSLGWHIFDHNSSLKTIYIEAENPPSTKNNWTFNEDIFGWVTLYVPLGCIEKYRSKKYWNNFWEIKEFNATQITRVKNSFCKERKRTYFYRLDGTRSKNARRGLNIYKDTDGKIRKEYVR